MSGEMNLALALLAAVALSAAGIMLDPDRFPRARWVLILGGTTLFGIALVLD